MKIESIVEEIDEWGEKEPERVVYRSATEDYTFGQLKTYSDALAHALATQLAPKEPILVFGELEFEMLVAFLAASKSGRAYIPIEASTPIERIQMILTVAKPGMIVCTKTWPELLDTDIPILSLDEMLPLCEQKGTDIGKLHPVQKNEDYYIIFTSGTTGLPKGVQISHTNLASYVQWQLSDFPIKTGMRFLSQAPYSFDLSVMSIYPALVSGGSLVPLEKKVVNEFKQLFAQLLNLAVDVWVSTPSFMDICLLEPTFDEQHVPSIQLFLFCGEELPKKTAKQLLERFPNAHLYNTYGPTEATVAVSAIEVTPDVLTEYERIPIGYIKEDTEVWIMREGTAVASGESGEIVLSGPSISKGYLNNPSKTKEAFATLDNQWVYHTGDTGRLLKNGRLLYEGRIDFQVKLHGYRIEVEEIEHHLNQLSLVNQAMVVPRYQGDKVTQLIAYVVSEKNQDTRASELSKKIRAALEGTIMHYMIPQRFIYVEQLPLTVNGKIDRKALIHEVNGS
ncbi:MAG: D-alanine--poly(phosphoribitol) ligase subunit DltA [Enterococcus sp.]